MGSSPASEAGGAVPTVPPGTWIPADGFDVLSVEYEPRFEDGHFDIVPPPRAVVEDHRGTETVPDRWEGLPAPVLVGTTLDGAAFDLADFRGSGVPLLHWASWCGASAAPHSTTSPLRPEPTLG